MEEETNPCPSIIIVAAVAEEGSFIKRINVGRAI